MFTWKEIRENYIVYEDEKILAVNKPAGITVEQDRNKIDLVTLAKEAGEKLFAVHRIDKETSGLVLFAKDIKTHGELTRQFAKRTVEKTYLAIVKSTKLPKSGFIDLPLSVGRKNRVRIAGFREDIKFDEKNNFWFLPEDKILKEVKNYPSQTEFRVLKKTPGRYLLQVHPITGRKNQIRVHFAWIDAEILGDPLFMKKSDTKEERMYLHSWKLKFKADWLKKEILLTAEPEDKFKD